MESFVEPVVERGSWWIHRGTRAEFQIDFLRGDKVYLLNTVGMPSGMYVETEFREQFYNYYETCELGVQYEA